MLAAIFQDSEYEPIECICQRDNKTYKYFTNIFYSKNNNERVIRKNGKFFVHKEYDAPLKNKIADLYFAILENYKNDFKLSRGLAKKYKDMPHKYYMAFKRFNFSQVDSSCVLEQKLKEFIKSENLFWAEILEKY